jgi:hypothetical protein
MYSGMMLTKYTGRILGAHQKIDRAARRQLTKLVPDLGFPSARDIIKFEGKNGPDGIKVKSPAKNEPWHYYKPFDNDDDSLLTIIQDHYRLLVSHLKDGNRERASFEAAWLAHAIVDGLTPAHHYPYEEKLTEIRGGQGKENRTTYKAKLVMPGDTAKEKVTNNWKMWGARGLYTAHTQFEMGVATLILPLRFGELVIDKLLIKRAKKLGITGLFEQIAKEIGSMEMYDKFLTNGWTPKLAVQVRHKLAPQLVSMVAIAWYMAAHEAGLVDVATVGATSA